MSAEPAITPQEFAQAVLDAFEAAGLHTDDELHDARGPSSTTMTKYRKVAAGVETMKEPRGDSYRAIDRAAGWEPGSARALWRRGARPVPQSEFLSSPKDLAALREYVLGADLPPAKREEILRVLDAG